MLHFRWLFLLLLFVAQCLLADSAAQVFDAYQDRVFQLRIIDKASNSKTSIGSGFVVNEQGWIVSNYHVIAQALHQPERYRIEIKPIVGELQSVQIIGLDVVQDLALLKPVRPVNVVSRFIPLARKAAEKGHLVYSIGNPHDLGMTLVEGTYNGLLAHSFYPRILFSGSLNSGMSGGPALNEQGELIGVNVATSGGQISFLVPVSAVNTLLQQGEVASDQLQALISRQLHANEQQMMGAILDADWPMLSLGEAQVAAEMNAYFRCWGGHEEEDEALYQLAYSRCYGDDSIYLSDTFRSGMVSYAFFWLSTEELNSWQFYKRYQSSFMDARAENQASSKDVSEFKCQNRFVMIGKGDKARESKVVFCTRNYKKYPGLLDLMLMAATVDKQTSGLISHVNVSGISTVSALAFSRKFLEHVTWK